MREYVGAGGVTEAPLGDGQENVFSISYIIVRRSMTARNRIWKVHKLVEVHLAVLRTGIEVSTGSVE